MRCMQWPEGGREGGREGEVAEWQGGTEGRKEGGTEGRREGDTYPDT